MCRKKPYVSRSAVKLAHKGAGFRFRAYQCPECQMAWHLTGTDKREAFEVWDDSLKHVRRSGNVSLAPSRTLEELEAIARRMRQR